MTESGQAASVHDRLLTLARKDGANFNLLHTRYTLERFLYRISVSQYKDAFLLTPPL